jgi:formate hydrogenlyase subunit 6/NADH:ubiquinone oxidoreductase subunit I
MIAYFHTIKTTILTSFRAARVTFRHLQKSVLKPRKAQQLAYEQFTAQPEGIVTLQYPHEQLPVPAIGRYKLHNEIDDCIVCDKCAKICPVDCIEIEAVKATEQIGTTSDGTPIRLYAAKFDIDMAKCCFCGLCTTVCPTECLTMTPEYDFSVYDITAMNFPFAKMTEHEIEDKKAVYAAHEAKKAAEKQAVAQEKNTEKSAQEVSSNDSNPPTTTETSTAKPRPTFKPKMKPPQA